MRALAVTTPGVTKVIDLPTPEINDYECLVRIRSGGICNCTDLEIIANDHVDSKLTFPLILGHEGAGEIVEVGKKVRYYQVGDRIVQPDNRFPPEYLSFHGNFCEYGIVRDLQAMAEAGVPLPPKEQTHAYWSRKFPREISFEDAGVLAPLRENFCVVKNTGVNENTRMLIYGDGPNGFGICRFAKLMGAAWVGVVGHHDDRLAHIKEKGLADAVINSHRQEVDEIVSGICLDMVVDAVGRLQILTKASHMVRPGGKVVLYSGVHRAHSQLDMYAWANNVSFHKHFYPYGDLELTEETTKLILDGVLDPKDFYSHTVPLEEFDRAAEMTRTRQAQKVVITI